jgi:acylglycerol lipase
MEHREGRIQGHGGLSIYWQAWLPSGDATTVVASVIIAHGLGEHGGRYRRVGEYLAGHGCATFAIDHRGHGKSEGARALVDRFDNAVADLDQLVDHARKERPHAPLFLLGHSMGGGLSLAYAIAHQDKLDGLLLSGATAALDGTSAATRLLARAVSLVAPSLGVYSVDPSAVSRDPAEVAAYATDPLNFHGKAPARTLGEIVRFVEALPAKLPRVTLPVLIMHGTTDKLVGVGASELVFREIGSQDKTLKLYEGLYHEIFNELPADRARVLADMGAWLEAHIS